MGGTVSTCPSPVSSEGGTYSLVGHSKYIHFEILNQQKTFFGVVQLIAEETSHHFEQTELKLKKLDETIAARCFQ